MSGTFTRPGHFIIALYKAITNVCFLTQYLLFYLLDDITNVIIRDTRPAGQAKATFEQFFAYPVHVTRIILVNRLFMHRLPQRTALYARRVQRHAHGLDVSVWFAIGVERCRCVCYSGRTAHSALLSHSLQNRSQINEHQQII